MFGLGKPPNDLACQGIPSAKLIEKRADVIIDYWKQYERKWNHRFNNELDVSLLNSNQSDGSYDAAIASLIQKAGYLIYDRGFQAYATTI